MIKIEHMILFKVSKKKFVEYKTWLLYHATRIGIILGLNEVPTKFEFHQWAKKKIEWM